MTKSAITIVGLVTCVIYIKLRSTS